MSAYSTLHLSRKKACEILLEHVMGYLSDTELAERLDPILAPRLYNVLITDNPDNDDHFLE